ncbi:MAG: TIM barrel protein [Rhodospirillales bacterium]|nr:TIM barrel protein [Rhodospirillales bacterium]
MSDRLNFAINHMTVARLRYDRVISIAAELGCVGVEFRNDLPGDLFDGDAPETVRRTAEDASIRILGLSEIKMFNDWSDQKRVEAEALMKTAKAIGAESVSLIPRNDGQGCGDGERQESLRVALGELAPMLESHGLVGLVEPLGFEISSLRRKEEAAEAIEALGARGTIQLVHDTFHHRLAGETRFFAEHTGIVHVSGVTDPTVPVSDMTDAHRILVDARDRLGNVEQISALLDQGYAGPISFEVFSPEVHQIEDPRQAIRESMAHLSREVCASPKMVVSTGDVEDQNSF